jgi:hypothetical protein
LIFILEMIFMEKKKIYFDDKTASLIFLRKIK